MFLPLGRQEAAGQVLGCPQRASSLHRPTLLLLPDLGNFPDSALSSPPPPTPPIRPVKCLIPSQEPEKSSCQSLRNVPEPGPLCSSVTEHTAALRLAEPLMDENAPSRRTPGARQGFDEPFVKSAAGSPNTDHRGSVRPQQQPCHCPPAPFPPTLPLPLRTRLFCLGRGFFFFFAGVWMSPVGTD